MTNVKLSSVGLIVLKDFARSFYSSKAWQSTRAAYAKSKGGLCELCLAKGMYKPCEIVHHKIHLTPENISNPEIALGWGNLQCVCRECHAQIHEQRMKRCVVDEFGRVTAKY